MAQNYILLERIELNASAASVTFSNIPQSGYTDLKIVWSARSDAGTTGANDGRMTFNGSSTGYSSRLLYGTGSATGSASNSGAYLYWSGASVSNGLTANTFSNNEIYIPNYLGSQAKSVSIDSVTENNGGYAVQIMTAGLWSGTSAISSITLSQDYGNYVANSTFSLYGLAAVGTTPVIAPKASGGSIYNDGTYWYHTFLSTDAFVPSSNLTCDYIIAAGGGGGGTASGGGGGAGGFKNYTSQSFAAATNYPVVIGSGGAGGAAGGYNSGTNGTGSTFNSTSTTGGGAGGGGGGYNGSNGGSGGGAGGQGTTAGTAVSGEGSAGAIGSSSAPNYGGGGAGGKGGAGTAGTSTTGGNGGAGTNAYSSWASATSTGVSGYYAGGGAGSIYGGGTPGTGGSGGGGNGGTFSPYTTGGDATANTGSGGGGAANNAGGGMRGGNGSSGIVIIRYAMA